MQRSDRVGDELRTVIADLVQNQIKDPRLPELISVVSVQASRDLSHAKVYVSVLGGEEDKQNGAAALRSAMGFIRREIALRMRLRVVPKLQFIFDDSIEHGIRISTLIDQAVRSDRTASDQVRPEPAQAEEDS